MQNRQFNQKVKSQKYKLSTDDIVAIANSLGLYMNGLKAKEAILFSC